MQKKSNKGRLWIFSLVLIALVSACGRMRLDESRLDTYIQADDVKVAAVGDSITAEYTPGAGYPEILDDLLGTGYAVLNFGASNYAAQASSDFPYRKTAAYQESLAFQPDIVLLMLGTNDAKTTNWQGVEAFKREYTELLKSYLMGESGVRVILAAPPTVFSENVFAGAIDPQNIPAIRRTIFEVAVEYNLEFVDLTAQTAQHPEWFFDGLHPTPAGAKEFARIFYQQIKKEAKKSGI